MYILSFLYTYYVHIIVGIFFLLECNVIVRPEHGFFIRWFRIAQHEALQSVLHHFGHRVIMIFIISRTTFLPRLANKKIITISIIIITTVLAIVSETLYINNEYFT